MTDRPLRIAILAHSTNPRGGVVHALSLGDALVRLGHEAVVHAPDPKGGGFFRQTLCETVSVPARPVSHDTFAMVETRAADYVRHFESAEHRRFDLFHAQDGISGNALATLKAAGLIGGYGRTVHHLDRFEDGRVMALQARSVLDASAHFVVSRTWQEHLKSRFGLASTVVGNGVDTGRFTPEADGREPALRHRLGIGAGPVFLSVGGIERRKNSVRILEAFVQIHRMFPTAQLIVAGGRSLLDHAAYRATYTALLSQASLPSQAVVEIAQVADGDMPALYRIADTLVFPSVAEGFGLVVLEAMASGLPVVTSAIAPFTEYLGADDVLWCEPTHVGSIADAMVLSLAAETRARLRRKGSAVAIRHDWLSTARAHLPAYATLKALEHA